MRFKHIIWISSIASGLCVLARALQLSLMVDEKGFNLTSYENYSAFVLVLLFLTAASLAVLGFQTHRCPAHPPKVSLTLAFPAVLYGGWMIFDVVHSFFSSKVPNWQIILLSAFGILTGVLFVLYGLKAFIKIKLPSVLFVLPVFYQLVRLLCVFISVSTLSLTSTHVLMLATDCTTLLFLLELAKSMCGIDKEKNYRMILAVGISATFFCAVSTIPYIVVSLAGKQFILNESYSSLILTFLAGAFIVAFLLSHFSMKNRQILKVSGPKTEDGEEEDPEANSAYFTS